MCLPQLQEFDWLASGPFHVMNMYVGAPLNPLQAEQEGGLQASHPPSKCLKQAIDGYAVLRHYLTSAQKSL